MGRFGAGLGVAADLVQAAEKAVQDALAPLGGRAPDLALAFASGPDAGAAGERALALCGARATLGCSAEGVLGAGVGVQGISAISVWVGVLPTASLRTFHLEVLPVNGSAAVVGLPERSATDEAVLLLADPFSFPADGFVRRAHGVLPGLPVVGALAYGPAGPGSTRLWVDGRTVGRGAVGVMLGGTGARAAVSQGCRAVGPTMTVTDADGYVVRALAGWPALDKVRHVLADLPPPDQALASAGLFLGVAAREDTEEHDLLARTVLGTDGPSGLVVAEHLEVGQSVRLLVRDADAADLDLRACLHRVGVPAGSGALLFSDRGRGARLFGPSYGSASHDVAAVRDVLSADAVAGFFAEGEVGPVAGRSFLHGMSASVLVLP
jgi:small ligand-binding sensory domain FIST